MIIDKVIAIVELEPELDGEMPEEMYLSLQGDKDACAQVLRIVVRVTKESIIKRLREADRLEGLMQNINSEGEK